MILRLMSKQHLRMPRPGTFVALMTVLAVELACIAYLVAVTLWAPR